MKASLISAVAFLMLVSWTRNMVVLHGQEEGWASIGPESGTVYALAIDPHDHSVVYAATNGGVFKTIDSGAHWSPVNAGLPMPRSAYQNGGPHIRSLAIDPQNTATVYAGVSFFGDVLFAEPSGIGVYRSDDGGKSWHAASSGIESRIVYALAIDPVTPTTVYAVGQFGPNGDSNIFKSTDGGASWSVGVPMLGDLAIDPQAPATVYAGIFKTTDGGVTWTRMSVPGIGALAINPIDSNVVYGAGGGGVLKSTDAGGSWTAVNTGLTGSSVRALVIDPQAPATLYAGLDNGAIFKTTNEGATWIPVNTGLEGSRITSLAVDPETPTIVYAGTERRGVFKTVNGGTQWSRTTLSSTRTFSIAVNSAAARVAVGDDRKCVSTRIGEGEWTFADSCPPSGGTGNGSVVALDPLVPTTAYAAGGGLSKSTDGGAHWSSLPLGSTFTVALDPVDPTTVYAGGSGAHKSVDGGATWTEINQGLSNGPLQLLMVDPQTATTLYAGFGGFRISSGSGGLYKSVNGGSNWALAMEGLPSVAALAIDPQVTSTIYAATASQVFKSTNGGESWASSSAGLATHDIVALAVHPAAPSIVFAGTYGGGVFTSRDGGASWSPMNQQPPNLLIRALTIDAGSSTLYAGTDGAGVFTIAAPAMFPLSVTTTGHGLGTIVSSPHGIDCGSACTGQFAVGTTVTLTATTAAGRIKGWTGCDSDSGPGRTSSCRVTIDVARTVTVTVVGPPIVPPGRDVHGQPGEVPRTPRGRAN
jgi:photosystem II stability/assembly factor-like uncharacterized protein